ncbi:hypothetical protein NC653_011219 [Populus alba x Populus x berolinensis]|uniref:Uncharacterized protein n=1 Tax=Populus alba x Populus x berolinensis TaxID=444605 RepID=A0AAD6W632_9ROSI|nr:hypothetical protein NC653_011219 [Populus alba x Populus x berolinensis]
MLVGIVNQNSFWVSESSVILLLRDGLCKCCCTLYQKQIHQQEEYCHVCVYLTRLCMVFNNNKKRGQKEKEGKGCVIKLYCLRHGGILHSLGLAIQ